MLREIKRLLAEHGRLSLRELSGYFGVSPATLEPMLDLLISKGSVALIQAGCSRGGGCRNCSCADRADVMIYELCRPA